jgi:hypothetical protein
MVMEDDMQSPFKSWVGHVEVEVLHYNYKFFMQDSLVGKQVSLQTYVLDCPT